MLKRYFGEIRTGRLTRLGYLGYSLLLMLIALSLALLLGVLLGVAEKVTDTDLAAAQHQLAEQFGFAAVLVIGLVGLLFTFAGLNLMAKRARDIGLPGWIFIAVLYALELGLSIGVSVNASAAIHGLALLGLLLVPGNLFPRRRTTLYADRRY